MFFYVVLLPMFTAACFTLCIVHINLQYAYLIIKKKKTCPPPLYKGKKKQNRCSLQSLLNLQMPSTSTRAGHRLFKVGPPRQLYHTFASLIGIAHVTGIEPAYVRTASALHSSMQRLRPLGRRTTSRSSEVGGI